MSLPRHGKLWFIVASWFILRASGQSIPECTGFFGSYKPGFFNGSIAHFSHPDRPTEGAATQMLLLEQDKRTDASWHFWTALTFQEDGYVRFKVTHTDAAQVHIFDDGKGLDGQMPNGINGGRFMMGGFHRTRQERRSDFIEVKKGEVRVIHLYYGRPATSHAQFLRLRWRLFGSHGTPQMEPDFGPLLCPRPLVADCTSMSDDRAVFPLDPSEDSSVQNPRRSERMRVLARKQNSEIVDLGHPGDPWRPEKTLRNCPYAESDLIEWNDAVGRNIPDHQDVSLPENTKVVVTACSDMDTRFGFITIPKSSELIFADEPKSLVTKGLRVLGALRAGSETCPLLSEISITLYGNRGMNRPMHFKGIDVDGGILDIHSVEYYHTWSRLAVSARRGDTVILLQDTVNWEQGARIIVTSTAMKDARDWHQNEEAVVESVSLSSHLRHGVAAVKLSSPIKYDHYGGDEYQAEVGLLSRRFLIQGERASSEPTDVTPLGCNDQRVASYPCENHLTGFGGHVIVRNNGIGRIEGVEFYRMGQTNIIGRYPIHFHFLGSYGSHSYVRSSSFHRSFYKCVTIHASDNVHVARNVAFDVIGHCLYLEDGVEMNNVIEFNLHAHVHPIGKPPGIGTDKQFLANIVNSNDIATPADATASGFYISNAHNYFRGNAAVGGYSGFQFPVLTEPMRNSRSRQITPRAMYSPEFDGNSCRSSGFWWGNAGCLYLGGEFVNTNRNGGTRYNAGRTINGLRTCQIDPGSDSHCPSDPGDTCTGKYPFGCAAYIEITNFKASLTKVGVMQWGTRTRFRNLEVHDFYNGPSVQLFGDNSIENYLATCRTENFPSVMQYCDVNSRKNPSVGLRHEGDQTRRVCKNYDSFPWRAKTNVVSWYDTSMKTLISDATFRSCDPNAWKGCEKNCLEQSAHFMFTAHSDQHIPEFMAITADIRFENDRNVLKHLVEFNKRDPPSISGRVAGWLSDGSVCERDHWASAIVGSNHDAGKWWRLDTSCVPVGRGGVATCCNAQNHWIASVIMTWDRDLDRQLAGGGGRLCDNSFGAARCPRVGYVAKFGDRDLTSDGLKLMQRAEITGPIPSRSRSRKFGWYVWFESGPPVDLVLSNTQIHHQGILIIAVTYPRRTTFDISMESEQCSSYGYLCRVRFTEVNSRAALTRSDSSKSYFVESSSNSVTLYVRVVQRDKRGLNEVWRRRTWSNNFEPALFTNDHLQRKMLDTRDWGIPHSSATATITIHANCPKTANGRYCAGGAQPVRIPSQI